MNGPEQRRLARANWPVRRVSLDAEEDRLVQGSPRELFMMVHQLTQDAWAMSGTPLPEYSRAATPGRVTRRPR